MRIIRLLPRRRLPPSAFNQLARPVSSSPLGSDEWGLTACLAGTVDRTIDLLASSRRLRFNLSSLSYHHYPAPIRHANNSKRSVLRSPAQELEQQQLADLTKKASKKVQEARETTRMTAGADRALRELVKMSLQGTGTLMVDFKAL